METINSKDLLKILEAVYDKQDARDDLAYSIATLRLIKATLGADASAALQGVLNNLADVEGYLNRNTEE